MLKAPGARIAQYAGLVVVVLVLVSWASTHSSSYEVCKQERYTSGDITPDFRKKVAYFFVCEGVTIDANGELLTALGTLAIAAFTWTLWRSSEKLWQASEAQRREARKALLIEIAATKASLAASAKAAVISQQAADAATRSAEVAADTAKKQLRAYVNVASAQVHNLNKASNRYIVVETQNFGQTPALEEQFWCGEHVREWPLKSILGEAPKELGIGKQTLPPGRKSIMRVPVGDLSELEERELREGRAGVYFWGVIKYRDVFGDPHFSNIRLVCEGDGLASGLMHDTEEGNESD